MAEVDRETEIEQNRINVAVIGDSLAKYFIPENEKSYRYNFKDFVSRGATFDSQCRVVAASGIPRSTQVVLIALGTNSLDELSVEQTWFQFTELLKICRRKEEHANIKIVITSILPKHKHSDIIQNKIKRFNKQLHDCASNLKYIYYKSSTVFLKCPSLFGEDGIHLTRLGYQKLHNHFFAAISLAIRKLK